MTIAGPHTSLRNAALSDASQSVAPGVLDHIVQFYESDEFLFETVSDFLAEGLVTGQPLIVIATPEHRTGFANALRSKGFDPVAARDNGQLVLLDARGVLGTFMVGAMPDAALFRVSVGGHIEASLKGSASTSVRAYGAMVDLLWRDGNPDAAIRLEELWTDLARTYSFELLCAYPMGNFYRESHGRHFEQICHSHGRVRPAESFARVQDADQMAREISALQQQARALAT